MNSSLSVSMVVADSMLCRSLPFVHGSSNPRHLLYEVLTVRQYFAKNVDTLSAPLLPSGWSPAKASFTVPLRASLRGFRRPDRNVSILRQQQDAMVSH